MIQFSPTMSATGEKVDSSHELNEITREIEHLEEKLQQVQDGIIFHPFLTRHPVGKTPKRLSKSISSSYMSITSPKTPLRYPTDRPRRKTMTDTATGVDGKARTDTGHNRSGVA